MVKDMTQGNPLKLILGFALPLIIGNLFQQFYSMADTIIVGRYVDMKALAAVGATGSLNFLILGFIIGVANGFGVIVAQRFGAERYDKMRNAVVWGGLLSLFLTILVTIFATLYCRRMLELMQTPDDIIDMAYDYIVVIFGGTFACMFYNYLSAILRALGDSKTPLYFLILSSILNVGLDLLLIIQFDMNVAGAAYATVISQGVSFVACLIYMKKKFAILRFTKEDFYWSSSTVKNLLAIGFPSGIQSSIIAIGCVVLQGAVNSFGSVTVAAFTAATKVEQIVSQILISLGVAAATFTGQNLGANRIDRIREGAKKTCIITLFCSVIFSLFLWFFGTILVYLFVSEYNEQLFSQAQLYLRTIAIPFAALALLFLYRNILQGLGNAFIPMLSGVFELIVRFITALYLAKKLGYFGLCIASPIAWISAAILLVSAYFVTMHRLKKREMAISDSSKEMHAAINA